jgi:hypothetical protein
MSAPVVMLCRTSASDPLLQIGSLWIEHADFTDMHWLMRIGLHLGVEFKVHNYSLSSLAE